MQINTLNDSNLGCCDDDLMSEPISIAEAGFRVGKEVGLIFSDFKPCMFCYGCDGCTECDKLAFVKYFKQGLAEKLSEKLDGHIIQEILDIFEV